MKPFLQAVAALLLPAVKYHPYLPRPRRSRSPEVRPRPTYRVTQPS
jgi:hypothetical protein